MKKLNRKGFTLVELLAVIIILAIVVGITIPAVLTTINNTRKKAYESAVSSVADWVDRQYQAYLVGNNDVATVDSYWKAACVDTNGIKSSCTISTDFLSAAGVKPSNFDLSSASNSITINKTTGRSCVKLLGSSTGDYQNKETTPQEGGIC